MEFLSWIGRAIAVLFTVCFSYQAVYTIISLFCKPKSFSEEMPNRFAVLIAARNEESVIGHLIDSIHGQDYPAEQLDIYVVADNCTDATAAIAAAHGAHVYERYSEKRGKGYALDYLLKKIKEQHGFDHYDGYFVFDADNLLEPDFVKAMNRVFSAGYKIITSYRNSKNYGTNWISAGYALWFLHEARFLNNPRMQLHSSCAISGTGFLMHKDIVKKYDGWRQHLLVEDIQFTAENILDGEIIGYCEDAILYDEQPETLAQSLTQRMRWVRGHMQIIRHYFGKLVAGMFSRKCLSCYDFLMTLFPAMVLSVAGTLITILQSVLLIIEGAYTEAITLAAETAVHSYVFMLLLGLLTLLTEWKQIRTTPRRKLLLLSGFPLFMATYIPIIIACLFHKVEWKPIRHSVAIGLSDISSTKENRK